MKIIYGLDDALMRLNKCIQYNDDETRVTRAEVMALDLPKSVWLVEYTAPVRLAWVGTSHHKARTALRVASKHATARLISASFDALLDWPSAPWLDAKPYNVLDNL